MRRARQEDESMSIRSPPGDMEVKGTTQRKLPTRLGSEDVVSSNEKPDVSSINWGNEGFP